MKEKQPNEISPDELYQFLENETEFFLFDVRNEEEFKKLHIEGKSSIPTLNIPYFDLIEKGGESDFKESVAHFIKSNLSSHLPKNKKIVVVCARGNSSAIISDILKNLGYEVSSLFGGMQEWGNFYDKKIVVDSPDLSITQVIRPSRGCLSYVIASKGIATVIDPFRKIQPYIDLFEKLKVTPQFILDTHAHADHISGGKELAEKYGVPYYLHPYDGIHPIDMLPAKFSYEASWADKTYRLGNVELKALHIPGHTLGNQAFLLDNKYLFAGDSIFIQSIARPDLGGQPKTWTILHYESLRKLLALQNDIIILPAHFSSFQEANTNQIYMSSLGELKKKNRGLIMAQKSLKEFSEYILENLPQFPKEYMDIKRVNLGLLQANEELATELEFGKNICAVR